MVLCLKTRKSRSLPDLVMLSRFLFIASPLTPLGRINQGAFLCIINKRVRSTDKSHKYARIYQIRPNLALPVIRKFIRTQSHIYRLNTPTPNPLLSRRASSPPEYKRKSAAPPAVLAGVSEDVVAKAAREQSDPSAFPLNVAERARAGEQ